MGRNKPSRLDTQDLLASEAGCCSNMLACAKLAASASADTHPKAVRKARMTFLGNSRAQQNLTA